MRCFLSKLPFRPPTVSRERGFVALTAVLIAASFALFVSYITGGSAAELVDQVAKKEYRMMSAWYAETCIDLAILELAHDYFARIDPPGRTIEPYFCTILSISGSGGERVVRTAGHYGGVRVEREARVKVTDHEVSRL